MWLENNTSEKIQSPVANEYTEVFGEKESEWKDTKRKKSKNQDKHKKTDEDSKHRKSKKSKSKKEYAKKSSDYEETAGISTPSKEILPDLKYNFTNSEDNTILELFTSYEELAKNKVLSITYELRQIPQESDKLIASILITNNCQKLVKELVLDIPDTSSLRLLRNVSYYANFKERQHPVILYFSLLLFYFSYYISYKIYFFLCVPFNLYDNKTKN